jgi:hypothetical protein
MRFSRAHIAILICGFSAIAPARELSKHHKTLLDYLTSVDFTHVVNSKRVLKPGSVAPQLSGSKPVCLVAITFNPVPDVKAKSTSTFHVCKAPGGVCQELIDCARDQSLPAKSELNPWAVLPLSEADADSNQLNDKCTSLSKLKDSLAAYQFYEGSAVAEQLCVTRYTCEKSPKVDALACPAVTETTSEGKRTACPRINGCLNTQVPMPEGYTETELLRLADKNPEKVKQVRAELAKPASVVAAKPAGNAVSLVTPSSQNYQSRTASIAGSRASTTAASAPPASTPPATGHAGRGMR